MVLVDMTILQDDPITAILATTDILTFGHLIPITIAATHHRITEIIETTIMITPRFAPWMSRCLVEKGSIDMASTQVIRVIALLIPHRCLLKSSALR